MNPTQLTTPKKVERISRNWPPKFPSLMASIHKNGFISQTLKHYIVSKPPGISKTYQFYMIWVENQILTFPQDLASFWAPNLRKMTKIHWKSGFKTKKSIIYSQKPKSWKTSMLSPLFWALGHMVSSICLSVRCWPLKFWSSPPFSGCMAAMWPIVRTLVLNFWLNPSPGHVETINLGALVNEYPRATGC